MSTKYIITAISTQSKRHNFYHDEMGGAIAEIVSIEIGSGAVIRYAPRHDDCYNSVITTAVKSFEACDGTLIIKTNNTIYTLHTVEEAEFTSVWDGGTAVTTSCKVNMVTKEVFDIEISESTADEVNCLDEEYITINGQNYPVFSDEDLDNNPEASGCYWYKS